MLIEFNVTNFRSILELQSLKMTANTASDLEENCFDPTVSGVPRLLRSAVIYGPNAAGKSNLIRAMDFMKRFVLTSAAERQEGEAIDATPFLFRSQSRSEASVFEVLFIENSIRYQYGFAVTGKRVAHEWLIAYPEGRSQRWFERDYDPTNNEFHWYFGSKFIGNRKILKESTRGNALFLSTAVMLNNKQLKPVFKWFQQLEIITRAEHLFENFTARLCEVESGKRKIIDFLNTADLSIADILLEKSSVSYNDYWSDISVGSKTEIRKNRSPWGLHRVQFLHKSDESGELTPLDLADESAGAQRLFTLAGPWLDILDHGRILLMDELDTSLHPFMVRFLIGLFHNPSINERNAQLVATTHDTSVLNRDIFRRDQVWFLEKDSRNTTCLYPLTDFSPRKTEVLEKGYLQGRYGALPFSRELPKARQDPRAIPLSKR